MNDFLTSGPCRIYFCCCDSQPATCSAPVEHQSVLVKSIPYLAVGVLSHGCWGWCFYGAHNHQATLGREGAEMELSTSKFDPKPSKSFQRKNYAHWQETVLAYVILLLSSVVECAGNKHHPRHSSWQAGDFRGWNEPWVSKVMWISPICL